MRKTLSAVVPIVMLCALAGGLVGAAHAEDADDRDRAMRTEIADRDGDRDGDHVNDRSGRREQRGRERHRGDDRHEHSSRHRRHG